MRKPKMLTRCCLALTLGLTGVVGLTPTPQAAAIDQPIVDIANLDMVPERTWGVSGLNSAITQTETLDVHVWDFAQVGNRMFVGGAFLNVQENKTSTPISQPYIAAFDLDSGDWIDTWTPSLDFPVYALDVTPDGALLVGGEFTQVNGTPRQGVVALDPLTGDIDPTFAGSVDRPWSERRAAVRDMAVVGNDIYIAGNFSHLDGINGSRTRIFKAGRFSNTGVIDTTWKPEVTGSAIWGLDLDTARGEVYFSGYFTAVNGEPDTGHFHTVDIDTGASTPGKIELPRNLPGVQPEMFDVVAGEDLVFVIGEQHVTQVLNSDDQKMIGWHGTGFSSETFAYSGGFAGGGYQAGERIGDIVFAGCHCTYSERNGKLSHFSSFTGKRTNHRLVMAYSARTGELIEDFKPDIHSPKDGTWAIASDTNGCLYIGGDFHAGGVDHGRPRWVGGFAKHCPLGNNNNDDPDNGNLDDVPEDNILAPGSAWKYKDDGGEPNPAWMQTGFGDAAWKDGTAEFGFGDGDEQTPITSEKTSYYFRSTFEVDGTLPPSVELALKADDGAIVYINGTEVLRDNLPLGRVTSKTGATTWRTGADEGFNSHYISSSALVQGTNTIAVEVHNVWWKNSDLSFDLAINPSNEVVAADNKLVEISSEWSYRDNTNGGLANWTNGLGAAPTGSAPLGFGQGNEATLVTPGQKTYYFSKEFNVDKAADHGSLELQLLADDGAVVYINGTEVHRYNMPAGEIKFSTAPLQWVSGADETFKTSTIPGAALVDGKNVIAVEIHNFWSGNGDLSFGLGLS